MGVFGGDAENPVGWLNWNSGSDIGFSNLVDDANAHSGSHSALLYEKDILGDEMVFYSEPVAANAEKWYKIGVWVKTDSINTDPDWYSSNVTPDRIDDRMGVNFFFHRDPLDIAWDLTGGDQFFYVDQLVDTLTGWTHFVAVAQAPSDAAGVSMRARFNPLPTGYAWYDDFHIQEIYDIIVGIEEDPTPISNIIPVDHALMQNYPNPFNPETIIEFQVPERGQVELNVFDMLGRKIKTLVNDVRPAGTYRVLWDGTTDSGSRVATGVYIYQLRGKNALITKKMTLIK
jgi:hypothetical protein